MGGNLSVCLSLSTTLRCSGFSRLQSIAVLIPPSLEIVTSLALVWAQNGRGKKHWYLVAEMWAYFALALVDFLAHMDDRITTSLSTFEFVDKTIGAISFFPLLCYTGFLLLFAISNLLPTIPRRQRAIIKYSLFASILPIIALHELGSLLGISYLQLSSGTLAVSFTSALSKSLWRFFSFTTLALLTLYQATIFFLSAFILVRQHVASHSTSRIASPTITDRAPTRGLAFIVAGAKLGAIETILGFASLEFEGAFARRLLRLCVRTLFAIGCIRGADGAEGFSLFHSPSMEELPPPRSIRGAIGNPRLSTFAQLSPHATTFYNLKNSAGPAGPSNSGLGPPRPRSRSLSQSKQGGSGWDATRDVVSRVNRYPSQRVTVHYDGRDAPALQLRFSDLAMPDAKLVVGDGQIASAVFGPKGPPKNSNFATTFAVTLPEKPKPISQVKYPRQSLFTNNAGMRDSAMSVASNASDALEVVREMASKFPGLPPRVVPRGRARSSAGAHASVMSSSNGLTHSSSTLSRVEEKSINEAASVMSWSDGASSLQARSSSRRKKPPPVPPAKETLEQILNTQQATHDAYRQQQVKHDLERQRSLPKTDGAPIMNPRELQNAIRDHASPFADPAQGWSYNPPASPSDHSPKSDFSFIDADFHTGTNSEAITRVPTLETAATTPFSMRTPYKANYSPTRDSIEITVQDRPRLAERVVGLERQRSNTDSSGHTQRQRSNTSGSDRTHRSRKTIDVEAARAYTRERMVSQLELDDGSEAEIEADRELAQREKAFPWLRNSAADSGVDVGEILDAAWQTAGLTRVQTISTARSTPVPISPGLVRPSSVYVMHGNTRSDSGSWAGSDISERGGRAKVLRPYVVPVRHDSGSNYVVEVGQSVGAKDRESYDSRMAAAASVPESPAPFSSIVTRRGVPLRG